MVNINDFAGTNTVVLMSNGVFAVENSNNAYTVYDGDNAFTATLTDILFWEENH